MADPTLSVSKRGRIAGIIGRKRNVGAFGKPQYQRRGVVERYTRSWVIADRNEAILRQARQQRKA